MQTWIYTKRFNCPSSWRLYASSYILVEKDLLLQGLPLDSNSSFSTPQKQVNFESIGRVCKSF